MPSIYSRYDELAKKAQITRGTKESLEWFRRRVRKDRNIKAIEKVQEGLKTAVKPTRGSMILYEYDPKHKDILPTYDRHPLIILLDTHRDGWYGINLHYLPPVMRVAILEEIGFGDTKPRNISLDRVKQSVERNPDTRPALKKYLSKQVRSRITVVPKAEWEIAIQLPFEAFEKTTIQKVWRKSRR